MEKINYYENIITEFLEDYASIKPAVTTDITYKIILDKENRHYQLLRMGFGRFKTFVHATIFHFQIQQDGKVWLWVNNTDMLIAEDLVRMGIARKDIVIGFLHESVREYADFVGA